MLQLSQISRSCVIPSSHVMCMGGKVNSKYHKSGFHHVIVLDWLHLNVWNSQIYLSSFYTYTLVHLYHSYMSTFLFMLWCVHVALLSCRRYFAYIHIYSIAYVAIKTHGVQTACLYKVTTWYYAQISQAYSVYLSLHNFKDIMWC